MPHMRASRAIARTGVCAFDGARVPLPDNQLYRAAISPSLRRREAVRRARRRERGRVVSRLRGPAGPWGPGVGGTRCDIGTPSDHSNQLPRMPYT